MKPNILWIQTDEQRPDSLGCYGSKWARTPNIDKLARMGTVFKNAVCQSPVCVPSRSSQLTGRYPQEFGCLNNRMYTAGKKLSEGYSTFTEVFEDEGYETVNFGKYHNVLKQAFQINKTTEILQDYCTFTSLNSNYSEKEYEVIKRPCKSKPLIVAGTYPGNENQDRISTERAIEYLRNAKQNEKPFLLRVSYTWPHTPTLAPPPYNQLYDPDDLPIRYYNDEAYQGRSLFDRLHADYHGMKHLSKEKIQQVWKDYMGLCAYIDYEAGRVLDSLDENGLRDSTIVVYSADHGKSLGEWGAGEKDNFDSEVWRVPFIWSWSGHIPQNQVIDECCELIDTGRTLLQLAGLDHKIPESYRGRNLFGDDPVPDSVFGAIHCSYCIPDSHYDPGLMRVAVRTDKYRMDMNWFMDGSLPPEDKQDGTLFDIKNDPYEIHNLWNDPLSKTVVRDLTSRLREWLDNAPPDSILANPDNAKLLF
jgi:choline-sulfatase